MFGKILCRAWLPRPKRAMPLAKMILARKDKRWRS